MVGIVFGGMNKSPKLILHANQKNGILFSQKKFKGGKNVSEVLTLKLKVFQIRKTNGSHFAFTILKCDKKCNFVS